MLSNILDDTTAIAEAKYSANITKSKKKLCLSSHYNADSNFPYSNGVMIHQFKAGDSETFQETFLSVAWKIWIEFVSLRFFCRLNRLNHDWDWIG